jgi:peroxiredoxin
MGLALACGSPSDSDASSTLVKADSTPPLIEAIHVSDITSSSATITFRTNEEASCQVRCDRMARGMASESEATELDTEHKITLKKLSEDTTYYFVVRAIDTNGNEGISDTQTFTTLLKIGCGVGNIAPDFTLRNLRGGDVTLSSYRGRVVVVNFWYIACPYCRAEMTYLQEAFEAWSSRDGPVLLAVNTKDAFSDVHNWMMGNTYTFTILIDEQKVMTKRYCLSKWPTTIVIGSDGIIKKIKPGASGTQKEIEEIIRSL